MNDAAPTLASCPNCGAPRLGKFCAQCGERFLDSDDFSLRHLLFRELPRELTDLDGKLVRTLRYLLTRPGFLAQEWVAGRRSGYVSPLRLYLIVFLLHVLALAAWPGSDMSLPDRAAQIDVTGVVGELAAAKGDSRFWNNPQLRERLADDGKWASEVGNFLIFLLVALVQQLIFLRSRRRYLEHAILAMNVTTFYILVSASAEITLGLLRAPPFGFLDHAVREVATALSFVSYWYFAIRRFYGASRLISTIATVLVAAAQVIIAMSVSIAVLVGLVRLA